VTRVLPRPSRAVGRARRLGLSRTQKLRLQPKLRPTDHVQCAPAIASPTSCQASPRDPASPPGAASSLTRDERPSVLSTAPGRESTWRHLILNASWSS